MKNLVNKLLVAVTVLFVYSCENELEKQEQQSKQLTIPVNEQSISTDETNENIYGVDRTKIRRPGEQGGS